jgi:hypothetical protein
MPRVLDLHLRFMSDCHLHILSSRVQIGWYTDHWKVVKVWITISDLLYCLAEGYFSVFTRNSVKVDEWLRSFTGWDPWRLIRFRSRSCNPQFLDWRSVIELRFPRRFGAHDSLYYSCNIFHIGYLIVETEKCEFIEYWFNLCNSIRNIGHDRKIVSICQSSIILKYILCTLQCLIWTSQLIFRFSQSTGLRLSILITVIRHPLDIEVNPCNRTFFRPVATWYLRYVVWKATLIYLYWV